MPERERELVAAAARRLGDRGLAPGTAGNVSVRIGERIAVTPTGAVLARARADEVAIVGIDGELLDGPHGPTSELALHLGVYRRYGAGAVVHAHPPMATALACVLDELPAVHYQMVELGGSVRVARYATFGTEALAAATLDGLEGRTAALMANHGALTFGDDLDQAMARMELLEWASEIYWRASAIGTPRILTERRLQEVREQLAVRRYGAIDSPTEVRA